VSDRIKNSEKTKWPTPPESETDVLLHADEIESVTSSLSLKNDK